MSELTAPTLGAQLTEVPHPVDTHKQPEHEQKNETDSREKKLQRATVVSFLGVTSSYLSFCLEAVPNEDPSLETEETLLAPTDEDETIRSLKNEIAGVLEEKNVQDAIATHSELTDAMEELFRLLPSTEDALATKKLKKENKILFLKGVLTALTHLKKVCTANEKHIVDLSLGILKSNFETYFAEEREFLQNLERYKIQHPTENYATLFESFGAFKTAVAVAESENLQELVATTYPEMYTQYFTSIAACIAQDGPPTSVPNEGQKEHAQHIQTQLRDLLRKVVTDTTLPLKSVVGLHASIPFQKALAGIYEAIHEYTSPALLEAVALGIHHCEQFIEQPDQEHLNNTPAAFAEIFSEKLLGSSIGQTAFTESDILKKEHYDLIEARIAKDPKLKKEQFDLYQAKHAQLITLLTESSRLSTEEKQEYYPALLQALRNKHAEADVTLPLSFTKDFSFRSPSAITVEIQKWIEQFRATLENNGVSLGITSAESQAIAEAATAFLATTAHKQYSTAFEHYCLQNTEKPSKGAYKEFLARELAVEATNNLWITTLIRLYEEQCYQDLSALTSLYSESTKEGEEKISKIKREGFLGRVQEKLTEIRSERTLFTVFEENWRTTQEKKLTIDPPFMGEEKAVYLATRLVLSNKDNTSLPEAQLKEKVFKTWIRGKESERLVEEGALHTLLKEEESIRDEANKVEDLFNASSELLEASSVAVTFTEITTAALALSVEAQKVLGAFTAAWDTVESGQESPLVSKTRLDEISILEAKKTLYRKSSDLSSEEKKCAVFKIWLERKRLIFKKKITESPQKIQSLDDAPKRLRANEKTQRELEPFLELIKPEKNLTTAQFIQETAIETLTNPEQKKALELLLAAQQSAYLHIYQLRGVIQHNFLFTRRSSEERASLLASLENVENSLSALSPKMSLSEANRALAVLCTKLYKQFSRENHTQILGMLDKLTKDVEAIEFVKNNTAYTTQATSEHILPSALTKPSLNPFKTAIETIQHLARHTKIGSFEFISLSISKLTLFQRESTKNILSKELVKKIYTAQKAFDRNTDTDLIALRQEATTVSKSRLQRMMNRWWKDEISRADETKKTNTTEQEKSSWWKKTSAAEQTTAETTPPVEITETARNASYAIKVGTNNAEKQAEILSKDPLSVTYHYILENLKLFVPKDAQAAGTNTIDQPFPLADTYSVVVVSKDPINPTKLRSQKITVPHALIHATDQATVAAGFRSFLESINNPSLWKPLSNKELTAKNKAWRNKTEKYIPPYKTSEYTDSENHFKANLVISIGDDPEHTTGTSLLEETVNKKLDPRVFGAAAWAHLSYTQETDDTTASTRDHFSTLVFPNHSYYDGATAQRLQPAATERAIEAASRLSEVPELPENTTLQDRLSNVALQFDAIPAHAETAPYRAHITNVVLDKQIEQKKGGPEKNLTQRSNELFAFYRTVNPNIKTSLLNLQTLTTSLALFNEDSPYGASHLLTKTESGELVPALQLYSREALALFKTDPNDLKADPARALRDFARILVPEMMVNDQLKKATEQDIGLVALMSKVGGESTQQRLLSTFLGLMAMEDMTRMLVGVPVMMSVVAATRPRETTLDTPAKMEQQEFITAGTGQAVSPTGKISQYQTTLGVFNDSEGNVVCSFRSDNDQANIDRAQKAAESMGKSLNEVLRYFYTIQEIISGNPLLAKALLG